MLLPRIRDDIDEYKKLNFHLYMVRIFFFLFLNNKMVVYIIYRH